MNLQRIDEVPYFLDVYDKNVKAYPDSKMLVDEKVARGLTRSQVEDVTGRIYSWLTKKGIGREDFVLICMPRGVWAVAAMIGVWKTGAALTIVEDSYVQERIDFIKEDCGCKAVIDMNVWPEIQQEDYKAGYVKADAHDAAFAVYTSGSTGKPKGVLQEYGNIKLNMLSSKSPEKGTRTDKDSRVGLIAPLNFVASTKTVLNLIYGTHCLYVIPYAITKNLTKFREYYMENRISNTFLSPSSIRAVGGDLSPYVKVVHTGSEPANGLYLEGVELVNNYSMSEGAFTVCQFVIDRKYDVCPVGKPNCDEVKISLLDSDGREVPAGESGEICFENPYFRGYINRPEENEKVFRNGLYHSGDIGKFDENGNLILLGRANDMIKLGGNRIEPAEVEAAFKAVTGVDWCAAKGFIKPQNSYIALFYKDEIDKDTMTLVAEMGQKVPEYMIPSYFVKVDKIPILPNGKLDRKALQDPMENFVRKEYVAPRTELEEKLSRIIAEVLGYDRVGITEDFYELGGNSLFAMEVIVRMDLEGLSTVDIFQGGTVERIIALYNEKLASMENISEEEKEKRARLSPRGVPVVQSNVIDFQLFSPKAPMWIFPFLLSFGKDADQERVYAAAKKIMEWHPIFSTVYEFGKDCTLQQRYDESKRAKLVIERMSDAEFEKEKKEKFTPFRMLGEPMIRMRMIVTDSNTFVLVIFHHIVMDGSSLQIIFRNFMRAYAGEELELDTYYSYLEDEEKASETASYREAKKYYDANYEGVDWCDNIEPDKKLPGNVNATYMIETSLSPDKLQQFEKNSGVSRNGFVSAVACLALASQTGKEDILTTFIYNNRADQRKRTAGGLLCRTIPVGVRMDRYETMADLYEGIRRQSADGIGNCVYDWAIIRENPYVNDIFPVVYETVSIMGYDFLRNAGVSMLPLDAHNEAALHRTMLQVFEMPDSITVRLSYMATIYSEEKIADFAKRFTYFTDRLIGAKDPKSIRIRDLLEEYTKR